MGPKAVFCKGISAALIVSRELYAGLQSCHPISTAPLSSGCLILTALYWPHYVSSNALRATNAGQIQERRTPHITARNSLLWWPSKVSMSLIDLSFFVRTQKRKDRAQRGCHSQLILNRWLIASQLTGLAIMRSWRDEQQDDCCK